MDWVLSNAHLELLVCDQPLIVYKKDKKNPQEHTKKELDAVWSKWEAKRKREGKSSDFSVGRKVDLNDFLRTGIDSFNNTKTK